MKDANPRIFRSLEKAAGPAEFDTIVAAAVSSYGALRQPSDTQARDFARLVLPVWDRLKPATRRALGASLSHCVNVPRGLVEKRMEEPIEISAPFLVSSPVLTEADRLRVAQERDIRRRPAPAMPAPSLDTPVEAPRAAPDETFAFARRNEAAATPQVAAAAPERREPGQAASAVRETLRRLVQPGQRPSRRMTMAELVELSVRGDAAEALSALATIAGIDATAVERIAEDESGERLAIALKAIGAGDADAMTILMMLKPKIGLDVAIFDIMARYYRALKRDDCVLLVGGQPRVEAPALEPLHEDAERPERAGQPRAAFGRRAERPAASQTRTRSA